MGFRRREARGFARFPSLLCLAHFRRNVLRAGARKFRSGTGFRQFRGAGCQVRLNSGQLLTQAANFLVVGLRGGGPCQGGLGLFGAVAQFGSRFLGSGQTGGSVGLPGFLRLGQRRVGFLLPALARVLYGSFCARLGAEDAHILFEIPGGAALFEIGLRFRRSQRESLLQLAVPRRFGRGELRHELLTRAIRFLCSTADAGQFCVACGEREFHLREFVAQPLGVGIDEIYWAFDCNGRRGCFRLGRHMGGDRKIDQRQRSAAATFEADEADRQLVRLIGACRRQIFEVVEVIRRQRP